MEKLKRICGMIIEKFKSIMDLSLCIFEKDHGYMYKTPVINDNQQRLQYAMMIADYVSAPKNLTQFI